MKIVFVTGSKNRLFLSKDRVKNKGRAEMVGIVSFERHR